MDKNSQKEESRWLIRGEYDAEGKYLIGFLSEDEKKSRIGRNLMRGMYILAAILIIPPILPPNALSWHLFSGPPGAILPAYLISFLFLCNFVFARLENNNQKLMVTNLGINVESTDGSQGSYEWSELTEAELMTRLLTFSDGRLLRLRLGTGKFAKETLEEIALLSGENSALRRAVNVEHRWQHLVWVIAAIWSIGILGIIYCVTRYSPTTRHDALGEFYALAILSGVFLGIRVFLLLMSFFYLPRINWARRYVDGT